MKNILAAAALTLALGQSLPRALAQEPGNSNHHWGGSSSPNNGRRPAEPARAPRHRPNPTPTPERRPNSARAAPARLYYSDDGSRAVQVYGERNTAVLLDRTQKDHAGGDKLIAELADFTVADQPDQGVLAVRFVWLAKVDSNGALNVATIVEIRHEVVGDDGAITVQASRFDMDGKPWGTPPAGAWDPAEKKGMKAPEGVQLSDQPPSGLNFDSNAR